MTGRRSPRAMGNDFAGVIEAAGDRVTRLHVGAEVLGGTLVTSAGACADVVVAQQKGVVTEPADRIIGINPAPANLIKGLMPGPSPAPIARPASKDLEEITRAAGPGRLRLPNHLRADPVRQPTIDVVGRVCGAGATRDPAPGGRRAAAPRCSSAVHVSIDT